MERRQVCLFCLSHNSIREGVKDKNRQKYIKSLSM